MTGRRVADHSHRAEGDRGQRENRRRCCVARSRCVDDPDPDVFRSSLRVRRIPRRRVAVRVVLQRQVRSPKRRYQRTATKITSGGNRKPANAERSAEDNGARRRRVTSTRSPASTRFVNATVPRTRLRRPPIVGRNQPLERRRGALRPRTRRASFGHPPFAGFGDGPSAGSISRC